MGRGGVWRYRRLRSWGCTSGCTRETSYAKKNNVFGGAVNIASRICGLSAPGEILVSDVVRGMARSSAGVVFEYRGEQALFGDAREMDLMGLTSTYTVYAVKES